jgi:hypothetical protein
MTAATRTPAASPRLRAAGRPGFAAARLLRLELRHNAMVPVLPFTIALFWLVTYRRVTGLPPLWNLRAAAAQSGAVVDFVAPVAGAAAWMGSREARRRITDLVTATARPRWARQLAAWATITIWAEAGCLGCLALLYGVTAKQASWGGPLWWPAAVVAASLPAFSALGFAAGTFLPGRLTAPLAAMAAFFALALSTELITGGQSYWQISPLVTGPWETGPDAGVATFYPYLPDLSMAQVMFLAGLTTALLGALALPAGSGGRSLRAAAAALTAAALLAAGTAVGLAGTRQLDEHGMIDIPALHDVASDRPVRFTPVCRLTAIPVCLNPAYLSYLSVTATALEPALSEIAGLPGAPVRIIQAAATYHQGPGNTVTIGRTGPPLAGTPPVYLLLLPDQLTGPPLTVDELASAVRTTDGPAIVASVVGDGPGASQAQHAVAAALMTVIGQPVSGRPPPGLARGVNQSPGLVPGTPAFAAARRFAARPAPARHAWLVRHLAALRAGRITLAQLP